LTSQSFTALAYALLRYPQDMCRSPSAFLWSSAMKKTFSVLALAAALGLAVSAPAQAGFFTFTGGTAGTIPGAGAVNDYLVPLFGGAASLNGYYGAQVSADIPGASALKFEFFGAEATYHNEFNFAGSELFDHAGGKIIAANLNAPLATFVTAFSGSGLLDFSFDYNNDFASVVNGANPNDASHTVGPNFFASCAPSGPGNPATCDSIYLFLDDGANGPDDNHDDFLVRVSVDVPEPSTLALFGAGLLAAGFVRRRRQRG
jgi:hypothetical protein